MTDNIVEGKIPKPDPNHVDVDTEVSNITTMQPKHSSAFSRTGVVRLGPTATKP